MDRPAMARSLGLFYLAAATLGTASLALPERPEANLYVTLGLIACTYAGGAFLTIAAPRLPGFAVPLFLALASVQIAFSVYLDGDGASIYGMYFIWVSVVAFFFLDRLQAVLQVAFLALAYGIALTSVETVAAERRWLITVGTALAGGLVVAYMREVINRLVAQLTDAARTDPLTGLLNRRGLEELFDVELERCRRANRPMALVVGDLDGFKAVNDRFGHAVGDQSLQRLAEELERWKRRIDMAARVGGEEFALLLPETDERGAFLLAERLRRATQRTFADGPVPLTISFGVASYPGHGDSAEALLRAADQALYAAKDLGKDRTVIFSPEVARVLAGDETADSELRLATMIGLAESLDIRDRGTADHCHTVGRYALLIGVELGMDPERVERVRLAGVLHDIGKVGVSTGLLAKPGPLDDDEWREMHTHPEVGARLLAGTDLEDIATWIAAHHERVDGSGYPKGLAGEEIPLEARILAVADAFEAMTADRVYSPALGDDAAREELIAGSGAQFDPEVVRALLRGLDRRTDVDPARAAAVTK